MAPRCWLYYKQSCEITGLLTSLTHCSGWCVRILPTTGSIGTYLLDSNDQPHRSSPAESGRIPTPIDGNPPGSSNEALDSLGSILPLKAPWLADLPWDGNMARNGIKSGTTITTPNPRHTDAHVCEWGTSPEGQTRWLLHVLIA